MISSFKGPTSAAIAGNQNYTQKKHAALEHVCVWQNIKTSAALKYNSVVSSGTYSIFSMTRSPMPAADDGLPNFVPVSHRPLGPSHNQQPITAICSQQFGKTRQSSTQGLCKARCYQKTAWFYHCCSRPTDVSPLRWRDGVRNGIVDPEWNSTNLVGWNPKVGYEFVLHPVGMNKNMVGQVILNFQ